MAGRGAEEITADVLRAVAGTVEDFATEAGVSPPTLFSWRAGRRSPGLETLAKVVAALRARADTLTDLAAELEEVADSTY